jgi:hypothetical protein
MIRFYRKHFRAAYPPGLFGLVVAGVWLRFAAVAGLLTVRRAVTKLATAPAVLKSRLQPTRLKPRPAAAPTASS